MAAGAGAGRGTNVVCGLGACGAYISTPGGAAAADGRDANGLSKSALLELLRPVALRRAAEGLAPNTLLSSASTMEDTTQTEPTMAQRLVKKCRKDCFCSLVRTASGDIDM